MHGPAPSHSCQGGVRREGSTQSKPGPTSVSRRHRHTPRRAGDSVMELSHPQLFVNETPPCVYKRHRNQSCVTLCTPQGSQRPRGSREAAPRRLTGKLSQCQLRSETPSLPPASERCVAVSAERLSQHKPQTPVPVPASPRGLVALTPAHSRVGLRSPGTCRKGWCRVVRRKRWRIALKVPAFWVTRSRASLSQDVRNEKVGG